eukprot:m.160592 g.160592  ORF g.160592 m.160592 type:complete len:430 (+) comp15170_c0_seq2:141-1430(+)
MGERFGFGSESSRKASVYEGFDLEEARKASVYGFEDEDEGFGADTLWVGTSQEAPQAQKINKFKRGSSVYRRASSNVVQEKIRIDFEKKLAEIKKRSTSGFKSTITLDNLAVGRVIGEGSFGTVAVCEPASESNKGHLESYMALKRQAKKDMVDDKKELEHLKNEKDLMFALKCEYLVHCIDYFQDKKYVYYLLELCNGGELWSIIRQQKKQRLQKKVAAFWLAQCMLGLEYMHTVDVAYRDLKPENCLIDYRGFLKLTDFGFAKQFTSITYTTCGTPDYMAPEIINSRGYTHAVDWWAYGVLAFEMVSGYAPFEHESQMKSFSLIKSAKYKCPSHVSQDMSACISKFLVVDPVSRLGTHVFKGGEKIRTLPLFKDLNWSALESGSGLSPYKPKVNGMGDVSPFDEYDAVRFKWTTGEDRFGDTFVGFG